MIPYSNKKSFGNLSSIIPTRTVQLYGDAFLGLGATYPLLYFTAPAIYRFDQSAVIVGVSMATSYKIPAATSEKFGAAVCRVPQNPSPIRLPDGANTQALSPNVNQVLYHQIYFSSGGNTNYANFVRQNSITWDLPFMPYFQAGESIGVAVASSSDIIFIAQTVANVHYFFVRDLDNAIL